MIDLNHQFFAVGHDPIVKVGVVVVVAVVVVVTSSTRPSCTSSIVGVGAFIRTSPKTVVYQATTLRRKVGYKCENAPCPSINNVIGIWDMKNVRNDLCHLPRITFICQGLEQLNWYCSGSQQQLVVVVSVGCPTVPTY